MHLLTPNTLTLGTYSGFAPIAWQHEGRTCGWDINFLQRFADQHGLRIETKFYPFAELWERVSQGVVDVAASGITYMPSRERNGVVWSASYFTVQRCLVIRAADHAKYASIADFAEQTIEVTPGSAADIDALQRKPASTRLSHCHNLNDAVQRLLSGEIAAFGTGDFSGYDYVRRFPGQLAVIDVHEMAGPEYFAFPTRQASGIVEALNAYIHAHRHEYEGNLQPT